MKKFKLDYFGGNEVLTTLGSLFIKLDDRNNSEWKINTRFKPNKNKRKFLPFSNIPVLAKKRVYNSDGKYRVNAWTQAFNIINTEDWGVIDASKYPGREISIFESKLKCFVFTIGNGTRVFLPQIELARFLFFHNKYLASEALNPSNISLDFDIQVDKENNRARINIIPGSDYTADLLKTSSDMSFLSWILLDTEAKRLYKSISRNQISHGIDEGGYRKWDFQFDTPSFADIEFDVRGEFDKDTNSLFVYEIEKIKNIPAEIPSEIEIYHPDFTINVDSNSENQTETESQDKKRKPIGDSEDIDLDLRTHKNNTGSSELVFSKPIITTKISNTVNRSTHKKASKKIDGPATSKPKGGNEWNNANDSTDHTRLYKKKFHLFAAMIDQLQSLNRSMVIENNPHPLPRIQSYSKYMLNSKDQLRYIADVTIKLDGKEVHILEIDMSDGDKHLSTKLIRVDDMRGWEENLKRIERDLIVNSLSWPTTKSFDDMFGAGMHDMMAHPTTIETGSLTQQVKNQWARNCYNKIESLLAN